MPTQLQVIEFEDKLRALELKIDDCVLIACHHYDNSKDVPILEQELQSGACIGDHMLLLGWALDDDFAKAIIIQIGLRVRNALQNYGKRLDMLAK
ncbi:hypothetical protein HDU99_008543 [Rhizoclosmatium hyalinum]|nr:hypothetical protein HDU99_008543 [Rhizoclosmatium hyalinum]